MNEIRNIAFSYEFGLFLEMHEINEQEGDVVKDVIPNSLYVCELKE